MPTIQANNDTRYFRFVPLSHCPFRSKYCGSQRLGAQGVAVLFDVDWHHDSVARHGCVCVLDLSKGCWAPGAFAVHPVSLAVATSLASGCAP